MLDVVIVCGLVAAIAAIGYKRKKFARYIGLRRGYNGVVLYPGSVYRVKVRFNGKMNIVEVYDCEDAYLTVMVCNNYSDYWEDGPFGSANGFAFGV